MRNQETGSFHLFVISYETLSVVQLLTHGEMLSIFDLKVSTGHEYVIKNVFYA